MDRKSLPDFMIVGAPKCATTSIHSYLEGHVDVSMSNPKELNFFSSKKIESVGCYYSDFKVTSLQEYSKIFLNMDDCKLKGEASVSYFTYPEVSRDIKKAIPDCKIIIVLRDPLQRTLSHYLMDRKLGFANRPILDFLKEFEVGNFDIRYYNQYIQNSMYYEGVKSYIDSFGVDNVLVLNQEEIKENIFSVLTKLANFLSIKNDWNNVNLASVNTYKMPRSKMLGYLYSLRTTRKILVKLVPRRILDSILNVIMTSKEKPGLSKEEEILLRSLLHADTEKFKNLMGKEYSKW